MNWMLIFRLSLFGLLMSVGTVFVIPSSVEPFCWLAIFLVCAYFIARQSGGRLFLHGLCLGLANSVWMTGGHVLLFKQYVEHHAEEAAMMASMPLAQHPRLMMLITGPIVGLMSGIVLGLFAWVFGKFVKSRAAGRS
jgi:hypothetical protein